MPAKSSGDPRASRLPIAVPLTARRQTLDVREVEKWLGYSRLRISSACEPSG